MNLVEKTYLSSENLLKNIKDYLSEYLTTNPFAPIAQIVFLPFVCTAL